VVVSRQNARVEMMSVLSREQARLMSTHPSVAKDDAGPSFTTDSIISKQVDSADGSGSSTVAVRGTTPAGIRMRSQVTSIKGRWFRPGSSEIAVPEKMLTRYAGSNSGGEMKMGGRTWTVVGIFDGGGSAFDSEIWTYVEDLMQAYHRYNAFSSVVSRAASPEDVPALI
ncbi:hypothetical protein OY671_010968, partial [Metschnikowia pulcherrima]